eukprot:CAMPEP_0170535632 /NCGR_PEP_ID=MMETSP0209-20121228/101709_1 /TAXON_ID=665100 ORGANISM="Litonotus pictus, Strain P1" /NCGR_SAMPLE_ID=MMETSP0209 /ASSEMBLY_ACC=CAM_ASM_000301 /LENGTH=472 /DNA_ID=CAMNT_0010836925 /DNA_START=122 /DNA_END=1539 /DNA_ORIENTATION=-
MNQQELLLDQTTKNKLIEFLFELETDSKINHFLTPIEWCNDTALLNDYNKIVEKPMDIYTIKHKIKNNFYINILEVKADLDLITQNCMNYNSEGSEIFTEANYMKNYCEVLFELFFPERFPEKDLGVNVRKARRTSLNSEREETSVTEKSEESEEKKNQLSLFEKLQSVGEVLFELFFPERFPEKDLGVNVRKARRTSLNSEREETSVTEKSEESQDKENQLSLFEKLRVLTNLQTLQAKQCNPKFFYDLAEEYSKKDFFCSSERNKELLIMLNLDLLSKEDETKLLAAVAEQMEVIKNREESPGERKGEAEHKKEGGTGQSSEKYPDSEDLFQHSENYLRRTEDVGKEGKELKEAPNLDLLSKEDETKLLAAVAEQMEAIKNREESLLERKGEEEHKKEGGTGQSSEKYPDSEDLFQHSENYLRITEDVGKGKEKTGKEGKASLDVANDEKLAQNIFNEEFKRVTRSNRKK